MHNAKNFFIPALLIVFSILAFGCQSESSDESAPTDSPAEEKPAEGEKTEPQPVDISEITHINWQWAEFTENNPAAQSVVADPENYTLTFWDDGTFSFKADCNNGGGSYTVEGNKIEFGPMMSTMAMCPPESLHDQYLALLGEIDTFGMTGDKLAFTLKEDAGEMRFNNGSPAEKPETPPESPVEPEKSDAYILIEKPAAGTELNASKPIKISGMGAGLFEGNVVVQILDAAGNELALQPTIIQSSEAGMGGEGPWETEISISLETPTEGKIVAFSPSPKDGEGWIASDEIAVTFHPKMSGNARIENTPWILRSFAQQEDINSLLTVYQVTAHFNAEDGTVSGVAGCNNYFTSYTVDRDKLTLNMPVGATRMMCPEAQMVLENNYLAALENVASYEITCNAMEILDAEGNPLLVFQVDPYSQSEAFTREELANTSYLNEFAKAGVVQLVDGMYREPVAEDSATELVVMLTNHAVFGDVTGDDIEDAVVVLVSQPGGSGSFYDLAVVRKQGEALTHMARILLGDRVQIKSMHIENGEIIVDMLTQGPDDPMCCPTQYVSNRYALESGELVLISSETIE